MKPNLNETISTAEAKSALVRSGYLLEYRIEHLLEKLGYVAEANCAVPDPLTQKSRELDVRARKAIGHTSDSGQLFSELLVECVNNPQPIAFFTKDHGYLRESRIRVGGLPAVLPESADLAARWLFLVEYLGADKYHPYSQGAVASQFCSFKRKANSQTDWMAFHEEHHFDCLNKLCMAVDYFEAQTLRDATNANNGWYATFFWPVVVVQGDLLDARPSKRAVKLRSVDHIRLHRSSATGGKENDYHIDIVTERGFSTFADQVDEAMKKIRSDLNARRDHVLACANRQRTEARNKAALEQVQTREPEG